MRMCEISYIFEPNSKYDCYQRRTHVVDAHKYGNKRYQEFRTHIRVSAEVSPPPDLNVVVP
jgi:hypothetical protein